MQIDYVYGNPPYEKDLHLKILNYCFKMAKETVFLHPARWIQSLTSPKELRHFDGYIKDITLIRDNTKVLFCGMDISGDLVISTLRPNTKKISEINKFAMRSFDFDPVVMESIYNKVIKNIKKSVKDVMKVDTLKDNAVVFSIIGGNGGADNAKMSKLVTSNQDCVYTNGIAEDGKSFAERRSNTAQDRGVIEHVRFNKYNEAKNFLDSLKTPFYIAVNSISKVDMHVHPDCIPFMDDYSEPWTEDRLCNYFGITDTERAELERAVAKPSNYHL